MLLNFWTKLQYAESYKVPRLKDIYSVNLHFTPGRCKMGEVLNSSKKSFFGVSTGFEPFVFPQFTSFHSVFHAFHGLMNSINWPALSVWVFIAQAGRALQR